MSGRRASGNRSLIDEFMPKDSIGTASSDTHREEHQRPPQPAEFERYVAMLDVELAGGNRVALPYASLLRISYDPSRGLELCYPSDRVGIEGRRLGPLYRAIRQHRQGSVRVSSGFEQESGDDPVITAVRWEQLDE